MIDIEKRDSLPGGWWFLLINGTPVVAARCLEVTRRFARIAAEASNAPYRDAMRLLTAEIGLCEDAAKALYFELQGPPPDRRSVN